MNPPVISATDWQGKLSWKALHPQRVEVLARFGAEPSSARVMLDQTDMLPYLQMGDRLTLEFCGMVKFQGYLTRIQTSHEGCPLVLVAEKHPRTWYRGRIHGGYENQTPTEILTRILGQQTGRILWVESLPSSPRSLDRLEFRGIPLFYAIDLLAKLAGNWLWWIGWDDQLHFIPPDSTVEHVWYADPERFSLRPGQSSSPIRNRFVFHGGVRDGQEYVRYFESPESEARYGLQDKTLIVRGITTETCFQYLRQAVLDASPYPVNYKWIDRLDGIPAAYPGERFELRHNPLFPLDADGIYRIAAEELCWQEDEFRIRYHLAQGLESASRYTRYIDHDPQGGNYPEISLGIFRLDGSALDSEAHLDS